jgi:hypothetical protein
MDYGDPLNIQAFQTSIQFLSRKTKLLRNNYSVLKVKICTITLLNCNVLKLKYVFMKCLINLVLS